MEHYTETPQTEDKKKMSTKKKVLIGVAGVFAVGAVGAGVTGGFNKEEAQTQQVQEEPKEETPEEVTPDPVVVDPPPPVDPVQPEPPVGVAPVEPEVTEPVAPMPEGEVEYFPGDFDLPQANDDEFISLVIDTTPSAAAYDPDAMVAVAMDTCAWIANGGTQDEMIIIVESVFEAGTPEWEAAVTTVIMGNAYYCPELYVD